MIEHLEISGVHMQVGDDLRKYVTKKIGNLDRFIPAASRQSVHVRVLLKETNKKGAKDCICEIVTTLPHEQLTITEGTMNIFAAVDIAEAKLRMQLKRYKELHSNPRLHQRLMARLKRQPA